MTLHVSRGKTHAYRAGLDHNRINPTSEAQASSDPLHQIRPAQIRLSQITFPTSFSPAVKK